MPKSNELKLEGCASTETVAECRKKDKKGGRVHAEDGIQSRSEKPRFLGPTGFSGGTGLFFRPVLQFHNRMDPDLERLAGEA